MEKPVSNKKIGTPAKKRKKLALGKGLGALFPETEPIGGQSSDYFQCRIDRIRPNRHQPRLRFSEDELEALRRSIQTQGILQPLLVRRDGKGYELIAGERRLRAAKKAGLNRVPVVVKEIGEAEMLEMSIIENIQREDLNPLEEADAYHHLMSRFDMTQDQVAERIGKSRSAVANFLRLRQLADTIKDSLMDGTLRMGHARALLGARTTALRNKAWRTVVSKQLSVRETENLIKRLNREKEPPKPAEMTSDDIYFTGVAEDLSRRFGTKVEIKRKGQKGRLEVAFYSNDDLDRILHLLKGA